MRAVCYARVSSAKQRDTDTIAAQLRMLPEHVARNGWQLVVDVATYVDDGRSAQAGKLDKRTGLAALLRDAQCGAFDVVVVVDIDRLTRSEDQAERGAILGALGAANVKIATLAGAVHDLRTDEGDLHSALAGYFAASWGRKHKLRIKAGKDTAIARGRKPAGPTPYGYVYSRATGKWSVDPVAGPLVVEIFQRVAAGESSVQICDDFARRNAPRPNHGEWSRERVWQVSTNTTYRGEWTADKRRKLTMPVPRIIDDELWHATQAALTAHGKRGLRRTKHVYLLEGLATCAQCGARIGIRSATVQRHGRISEAAYVCGNRKLAHRATDRCDAVINWVSVIDAAVWQAVARELGDPSLPQLVADRINGNRINAGAFRDDAKLWRAKLAKLDAHESATLARARRGQISERALDTELAAIGRERAALTGQLATADTAAQQATHATVRADAVAARLRAIADGLDQLTPTDRAKLVRDLVPVGGAIIDGATVRISLTVPQLPAIDYASDAGCSTQHENHQRLRIVAGGANIKAGKSK